MVEQLIDFFNSNQIFSSLVVGFKYLYYSFLQLFDNASLLRITALIIMSVAISMVVFLIVVLYIKSLIEFISQNGKEHKKLGGSSSERGGIFEGTPEQELEKELERELEMEVFTHKSLEAEPCLVMPKLEELSHQKNKEKVELDWKKGDLQPELSVQVMPNISYAPSYKPMTELVGLAIDMLSRGIDEFKIAQTLMYKSNNVYSEDEILQTIDALKTFATLCAKGAFRDVNVDEHSAVVSLMNSDTAPTLLLIESLMDSKIEKASILPKGKKKEALFEETSHLANLFGTIASLSDDELSLGAYELSLEMYPKNINSWSKIGNIYHKLQKQDKATWAYKNVLELGDVEQYPAEFANAQSMLSTYYYATGNAVEASDLYNSSKKFYDMIGINRQLEKKEVEIVDFIELNKNVTSDATAIKFINSHQRSA